MKKNWSLSSACCRLHLRNRFAVVFCCSGVFGDCPTHQPLRCWSLVFPSLSRSFHRLVVQCLNPIMAQPRVCAFCPHDNLSSGLLCSALCSGRRVLCTSFPPRLHGHVLQHWICVSFVLVRAWLLMFSRPSWGGVMTQFAQEMFRQHLSAIPVVSACSSASAELGLNDCCVHG